jgi:hypothetical protein
VSRALILSMFHEIRHDIQGDKLSLVQVAPPRLRTAAEEGERSATWLELFYDLVFVVAVAILVGRLLEDITGPGVASFFGYFALLWWLWASHTYYADRYDTDDLVYRLLAAGQMVAIVVVAASLSGDAAGSTRAFAFGYAASRVLLVVMYVRAYRHVSETRALVKGYLIGFGIATAVWAASALVPDEMRVVLWAVALSIDLATPWVMRSEQARVPLDVSHLPERFGLFTILVLGESMAAVVAGLSHISWAFVPTLTAGLIRRGRHGALVAVFRQRIRFGRASRCRRTSHMAPDRLDLHPPHSGCGSGSVGCRSGTGRDWGRARTNVRVRPLAARRIGERGLGLSSVDPVRLDVFG